MTSKTPPTNLRALCKRSKKPLSGDIFAFQILPLPDRYFFGRVVATDTTIGNMPTPMAILIYLYKVASPSTADIPKLDPHELLVPPLGTNALAWTRGYFLTLRNEPLTKRDRLEQHCFKDAWTGKYRDEYGRQLPGPVPPIGFYGLAGIGSIDRQISEALGLLA